MITMAWVKLVLLLDISLPPSKYSPSLTSCSGADFLSSFTLAWLLRGNFLLHTQGEGPQNNRWAGCQNCYRLKFAVCLSFYPFRKAVRVLLSFCSCPIIYCTGGEETTFLVSSQKVSPETDSRISTSPRNLQLWAYGHGKVELGGCHSWKGEEYILYVGERGEYLVTRGWIWGVISTVLYIFHLPFRYMQLSS